MSWVMLCLLKEPLKLGVNNEVLVVWGSELMRIFPQTADAATSFREPKNPQGTAGIGSWHREELAGLGGRLASGWGSNSESSKN